jgi:hypothetical protein
MQQGSSAATKPTGETALKAEVRKTEGVVAQEALLSTTSGGKTAAPAACDQQGAHTETERREIDLTLNGVMDAIVGDSGIFGARKSAVRDLEGALEPASDDSNLLIELIAGALGIATGGIVGLVTSRLLTAFGAIATAAPHNAIGPAPKADIGSRIIVTTVASSLQGMLKGEAKGAATTAVGTALQTPGEKPSVLAFVNGQIDALEAISRERQGRLPDGFWGQVSVGGQWGFTINKANKNYKAELQLNHIDRPYLANHGKDFFGMGFGADPQLVADIAVHRDLLGAKLGG